MLKTSRFAFVAGWKAETCRFSGDVRVSMAHVDGEGVVEVMGEEGMAEGGMKQSSTFGVVDVHVNGTPDEMPG